MTLRFLSLLLLLALAAPAWAQAPDTLALPEGALPALTVTATRTALDATAAPARVMVLGPAALRRSGTHSVGTLLAQRSGAFVRQYGPGGLSSLSLRGTTASQTLLLLDGQRLAAPQLGQLDLSLLPTIVLQSVEVLHGAASALYGSEAVGGVVHLRTQAPSAGPVARLAATYGPYGEREAGVFLGGTRGAYSATVAAETYAQAGDFPYLNTALFPPREVQRAGADVQRQTLYGTLGYRRGRHRARLGGWHTEAARGLPTPSTLPPRDERQDDTHRRFWAQDELRLGRGTLRLAGLLQTHRLRYQNPRLVLDDTGRTRVATLEATYTAVLHTRHLFGAGVTASHGRARHPSLAEAATERHLGAFTHLTAQQGRLRLFPALRLDTYATPAGPQRTALSPRLGLNLQPFTNAGLHLKAGAGRAFRTPTFNDRFWQPGGNPALQPERAWSYDGGVMLQRTRARHALTLEATAFRHQVRDQIVWQPQPEGYWAPDNIGRVHSRGLETSTQLRLQPRPRLALDAGLLHTLTHARDRSDPEAAAFGQPLRYVPRHQLKAHAGLRWRAWAATAGFRRISRRFVTTDGSQALPAYAVLDATLQGTLPLHGLHLSLGLHADNLLNTTYEGIKGYPMPPRTLRVRLLAHWPGRH